MLKTVISACICRNPATILGISYSHQAGPFVRRSKLVVLIQICRFQQSSYLGFLRLLRCVCSQQRILTIFSEKLCIVPGKLLELDEEITQEQLELRDIGIQAEETIDKGLYLRPNL